MRPVSLLRVSIPATNSQDLASSDGVTCETYSGIFRVVRNTNPVESWQGKDIYCVKFDRGGTKRRAPTCVDKSNDLVSFARNGLSETAMIYFHVHFISAIG